MKYLNLLYGNLDIYSTKGYTLFGHTQYAHGNVVLLPLSVPLSRNFVLTNTETTVVALGNPFTTDVLINFRGRIGVQLPATSTVSGLAASVTAHICSNASQASPSLCPSL